MIQTEQEKTAEIRKCGTSAILVCLQIPISAEQILKIINLNYINACSRLKGLSILEFTIGQINLKFRKSLLKKE